MSWRSSVVEAPNAVLGWTKGRTRMAVATAQRWRRSVPAKLLGHARRPPGETLGPVRGAAASFRELERRLLRATMLSITRLLISDFKRSRCQSADRLLLRNAKYLTLQR